MMKFLALRMTKKYTKMFMTGQSIPLNVNTVPSGRSANVKSRCTWKIHVKHPEHETTCKICGKVVYSIPGLLDHLQKEQNVEFTHYCKKYTFSDGK